MARLSVSCEGEAGEVALSLALAAVWQTEGWEHQTRTVGKRIPEGAASSNIAGKASAALWRTFVFLLVYFAHVYSLRTVRR